MLTASLILASLALTAAIRGIRGRALRASDGVLAVVAGISVLGALIVSETETSRSGVVLARAVLFLGPILAALYGIVSDRADSRLNGVDAAGKTV